MELNKQVEKKSWYQKPWVMTLIVLGFIFFGVAVFSLPEPGTTTQSSQTSQSAESEVSKAEAQEKLDDIFKLAKEAKLVTSYEFSNMENVVYIGPTWYSQPVSFKKDFLAGIAMNKEIVTGYHRFEVRDSISNEKVAEVTAFSGSIEIYK